MTAPLVNPLYRRAVTESLGGSGRVGNGAGTPRWRAVDVLRPCCEAQGMEIWQAVYMRDNLLLHHRWVLVGRGVVGRGWILCIPTFTHRDSHF